jgi:hypothetical protein
VHSDEFGRFSIPNIIRGSMISVVGHAGAPDDPTTTWRFSGRQWSPVDDRYSLGILLPVSNCSYAERPVGVALDIFMSGSAEDRCYDAESRRWRLPVPTFDPSDGWPDPPGDAVPIWHVGRPDRREERFGRTVVFRRSFAVPGDVSDVVGYLTVNADDYAAVHVNGHWIGQCAFWQSSHTFVIPGEYLAAGDNELYFVVRNGPGGGRDYYNPGCLAYMLELIEPGL